MVTSQEKLGDVVDALGDRRIELARLQDRFPDRLRVDLEPTDITEVTSKRVLTKTTDAEKELKKLFNKHKNRLATHIQLQKTSRRSEPDERGFVNLYPFLPYQIDLVIDIVSGLRAQPGASRHTGGSSRTIIKHAQQMIIHPETDLGSQPVGKLVSLDLVYELLKPNLVSERRKDIADVESRLAEDPLASKVAKAIALLEFVRDLPRTQENLAAVLCDQVEGQPLEEPVKASLSRLEDAQFIRQTPDGWKLQTALEKDWDSERREIGPKLAQRKELRVEILRAIFGEPKLRAYRYRDLRTFRLAVEADGRTITEGDIPVILTLAEDEADFESLCRDAREASRPNTAGENKLFWVTPMTQEVLKGLTELYCSIEMIARHEREAKTKDEYTLVQSEKDKRDTLSRNLRADLQSAFLRGKTYFRGVEDPASAWGQTLTDGLKAFLDKAAPELYPKFDLGAYTVDERDAEKFLTASNLAGLPTVYYEGKEKMGLIQQEQGRFVIDKDAPVAAEVMSFIQRMHSYGEKITGRAVEDRFQGMPYGWDLGVAKVVLAALVRKGILEVSYQGRRYRDYRDPAVREVFTKVPAFRSSAVAPREALDFTILSSAARNFEQIYGRELDLEEGVIAQAVIERAREERELVLPLEARVKALELPGGDFLTEFRAVLEGLISSAPDDVVKTFANDGVGYRQAREQMGRIQTGTSGSNVDTLQQAQLAVIRLLPVLASRKPADDPILSVGERLREILKTESVYDRMADIGRDTADIVRTYRDLYSERHQERRRLYEDAIDVLMNQAEWASIPDEAKERLLRPLESRACGSLALEQAYCQTCNATLDQIGSDIAAVDGLLNQALGRLAELTTADAKVARVKPLDFFRGAIQDPGDLDQRIEALREHIKKLLAEGARIIFE